MINQPRYSSSARCHQAHRGPNQPVRWRAIRVERFYEPQTYKPTIIVTWEEEAPFKHDVFTARYYLDGFVGNKQCDHEWYEGRPPWCEPRADRRTVASLSNDEMRWSGEL